MKMMFNLEKSKRHQQLRIVGMEGEALQMYLSELVTWSYPSEWGLITKIQENNFPWTINASFCLQFIQYSLGVEWFKRKQT